jgi:hypothetical protein
MEDAAARLICLLAGVLTLGVGCVDTSRDVAETSHAVVADGPNCTCQCRNGGVDLYSNNLPGDTTTDYTVPLGTDARCSDKDQGGCKGYVDSRKNIQVAGNYNHCH